MRYAFAVTEDAITTKGKGSPSFTLASGKVDRSGDRILVAGVGLEDFNPNPVALYQHDHSRPIGMWEDVRKIGTGFAGKLLGDLRLGPAGASAAVDEARALIAAGILKGASVGLIVQEASPNEHGGYDITKSSLIEVSVCSIPMNAETLAASFRARRGEQVYRVHIEDLAAVTAGICVRTLARPDVRAAIAKAVLL